MQKLKTLAEQIGIELTEQQLEQFRIYYEYLVEVNQVMNLTAITEKDEVIVKHFLDSLAIVKVFDMNEVDTVIDVGTGAGFPGIPLKIAFPHLNITLMDSLNKRVKFLREVGEKLEFFDFEAVHARAEDLGKHKDYREQYDVCVSRAVSNLATLSEYCMPFVKVGGSFISYKGNNIAEELKESERAIHVLGAKIKNQEEFLLPESDITRNFITIKKEKMTPKKYPRKAGTPAKEPIK